MGDLRRQPGAAAAAPPQAEAGGADSDDECEPEAAEQLLEGWELGVSRLWANFYLRRPHDGPPPTEPVSRGRDGGGIGRRARGRGRGPAAPGGAAGAEPPAVLAPSLPARLLCRRAGTRRRRSWQPLPAAQHGCACCQTCLAA